MMCIRGPGPYVNAPSGAYEADEIGDENAGDNQQATHVGQSASRVVVERKTGQINRLARLADRNLQDCRGRSSTIGTCGTIARESRIGKIQGGVERYQKILVLGRLLAGGTGGADLAADSLGTRSISLP